MKKNKIIIIVIVIVAIIIGISIYSTLTPKDSIKFKKEYELYNNVNDQKNNKYHTLTIEKENPIIYLKDDNIIKELTTGDKIIYFGYPDNNPSRIAVPILLETAKDNGVEKIYYYNFKNIQNDYEKGNIQNKIYKKIINQIGDNIKETYTKGNLKGEKKLSAPTVILIKDGKVANYHRGTVSSYKDSNKKLTKKEQEELYKTYEDIMIDYIMCSSNCG